MSWASHEARKLHAKRALGVRLLSLASKNYSAAKAAWGDERTTAGRSRDDSASLSALNTATLNTLAVPPR